VRRRCSKDGVERDADGFDVPVHIDGWVRRQLQDQSVEQRRAHARGGERVDVRSDGAVGLRTADELRDLLERFVAARPDDAHHTFVPQRFAPQLDRDPAPALLVRFVEAAERRGDQLRERCSEIGLCGHRFQHAGSGRPMRLGDRFDDVLLAGEVPVDRSRAQPGFGGDVGDGRALEPVPREARDRGVEDPRAPGCQVLLGHARHQRRRASAT
jgi:hypothetical protein